jgi:hypothetical protein
MTQSALKDALKQLGADAPSELNPVLDALGDEGEDAAEEAWQKIIGETLNED